MDNLIPDAPQVPVSSEQVTATKSEVFVISRSVFNMSIAVLISFALGILTAFLFSTQSAEAHRAEHQQLINQAVNAAIEAQGSRDTANNGNRLDSNSRVEVSVDDDPAHGPADAPITIIEFSDFNCQYCGRFARDTLPLLRQNYGDQIHFVYRDFAILGPTSVDAAIASECANDQDAFWVYHDLLFANQGNFSQESLITYAAQAELNTERFTACLTDSAMRQEVLADTAEAQRLGATGTPTFFINGRPVVGAQPYEVFVSVIDAELAGAGASTTP